METLHRWFAPDPAQGMVVWTKEENKKFERALAIHDKNTADRWDKIARMIPGKTVSDVMNQYRELEDDASDIEAGLVPIPGYLSSSEFMFDDTRFHGVRKRSLSSHLAAAEHEKKKGVPWTEDEHKRFLMGLVKHGKGDWRNISRNFVITKTPTQVASHAQKYFIRLNSGVKDKRRPSIHDITTGSLAESDTDKSHQSTAMVVPREEVEVNMSYSIEAPKVEDVAGWTLEVNDMMEPISMFDLAQRDLSITLPLTYQTDSLHGPRVQGQNIYQVAYRRAHNPMFHAQSSKQRIVG
ncbi:unnamed protein product [Rhodiola kirilowii]